MRMYQTPQQAGLGMSNEAHLYALSQQGNESLSYATLHGASHCTIGYATNCIGTKP